MKNYVIILLSLFVLSSCADKQKEFSHIEKGMTKEQVVLQVGEPSSKSDILVAEVWKYDTADRTIVFRNGEVYDVITSAEARVDSIESSLKETGRDVEDAGRSVGQDIKEVGRDVKEKLKQAGDTIDSASRRLKNKIDGNSVRKN